MNEFVFYVDTNLPIEDENVMNGTRCFPIYDKNQHFINGYVEAEKIVDCKGIINSGVNESPESFELNKYIIERKRK
jgi:hypothetical protein